MEAALTELQEKVYGDRHGAYGQHESLLSQNESLLSQLASGQRERAALVTQHDELQETLT